MRIMVVIGSVRPGRIGPTIADWVVRSIADRHPDAEVDAGLREGLGHSRRFGAPTWCVLIEVSRACGGSGLVVEAVTR